jgi:iron complex outermembrane receptor protein
VGILFSLPLFLPSGVFASDPSSDLMEMSTEDLMRVNVYTASRFEQKLSEAPASVTIITASEIQKYGWRTLTNTSCDIHAKLHP